METLEVNTGDKISTIDIVGPEWPLYNYMQIILSPDTDYELADIPWKLADESAPLNIHEEDQQHSVAESSPSQLSAIPEGPNQVAASVYPTSPTYLQGCGDEELWKEVDNNAKQCIQEHAELQYTVDLDPENYAANYPYEDYSPDVPDPSASTYWQTRCDHMSHLLAKYTARCECM